MKKNPFEQFENNEQPKEIQKSEIFGALKNYNNPMMIKKTGKEIKAQINDIILPFLANKKDEIQTALSEFLSNAVVLPTNPCWMKIKMDETEFPYKQYTWEEMNWSEKSFGQIFKGFGDIEIEEDCCEGESCENVAKVYPYYPQSKEEAEARQKYNNLVEDFRDVIMDIKTANVLLGSLKDEDEYYLTVEQLVGLKFGE